MQSQDRLEILNFNSTLGVIGVGMGRLRKQVQILKIIANDFIRVADNCENKATRAMHEH